MMSINEDQFYVSGFSFGCCCCCCLKSNRIECLDHNKKALAKEKLLRSIINTFKNNSALK